MTEWKSKRKEVMHVKKRVFQWSLNRELSLNAVVSDCAVAALRSWWPKWPGKQGAAHTAVVTVVISHRAINAHNQRCLSKCVCVYAEHTCRGLPAYYNQTASYYLTTEKLWVISHHASSGTVGGQEPHHISSLSDLGGKLPSLNSNVQERKRGTQKGDRKSPSDWQWDSKRHKKDRCYVWKEHNESKGEWQSSLTVSTKKETTQQWQRTAGALSIIRLNESIPLIKPEQSSISALVRIYLISALLLLLISKQLWLHWIEQWLCIDLFSPVRTDVIRAFYPQAERGRWWRARLAETGGSAGKKGCAYRQGPKNRTSKIKCT